MIPTRPRPALRQDIWRLEQQGQQQPGAGGFDPAGTAAALVAAHVAAGDPHPGYLTPAEANALYQPIGSSSVVKGSALVTVPGPAGRLEHEATISAPGVTSSMVVALSVGAHADSDENSAEMLDIAALGAAAGADTIVVTLSFSQRTSGPIRLNYLAS